MTWCDAWNGGTYGMVWRMKWCDEWHTGVSALWRSASSVFMLATASATGVLLPAYGPRNVLQIAIGCTQSSFLRPSIYTEEAGGIGWHSAWLYAADAADLPPWSGSAGAPDYSGVRKWQAARRRCVAASYTPMLASAPDPPPRSQSWQIGLCWKSLRAWWTGVRLHTWFARHWQSPGNSCRDGQPALGGGRGSKAAEFINYTCTTVILLICFCPQCTMCGWQWPTCAMFPEQSRYS